MKKNILFFGALMGALLLVSCSGGNKKQAASSVSSEELDNSIGMYLKTISSLLSLLCGCSLPIIRTVSWSGE